MIPRKSLARVSLQRVQEAVSKRQRDLVAVEEPLEIRIIYRRDGALLEKSIAITMRTPGDDFQLAAGFLFTEGVIEKPDQIVEMSYCVGREKTKQEYNAISVHLADHVQFDESLLQRNFYTTSSCGVCGKASLEALQVRGCRLLPETGARFGEEMILQLSNKIRAAQAVFDQTGGLHAAALFDVHGDLISLYEDVGRHNAVDKLIGRQLLDNKIPLENYLLLVSGRTSFEIMQKALTAQIPVVAAIGAPSSLAIELARQFGLTLIGFLRGTSFNIYSWPARIALAARART